MSRLQLVVIYHIGQFQRLPQILSCTRKNHRVEAHGVDHVTFWNFFSIDFVNFEKMVRVVTEINPFSTTVHAAQRAVINGMINCLAIFQKMHLNLSITGKDRS